MNMKIRAAKTPSEKEIVARLQDQVMGLASIHQRLYQANDPTAVRCDELLTDLTENLVPSISGADGEIRLTVETEPVVLGPDKAIPLALFATETIVNALEHGAAASDGGWLFVSLKHGEGATLILTVANLKTTGPREEDGLNAAIGSQLIRAFNNQLSGEMIIEEDGLEYRVTLTFEGESAQSR